MTETNLDLPAGWRWAPFSEVAEHRLGKMLDKRKNEGTPRPYLRNINVRWHGFDLSDVREMRVGDAEMKKYTVHKGDLVICEGGEPGRAAIWTRDEPMVYQKALHRARPREGVEAGYLLYFLENEAASGRLAEHFTGSTINHLTGRALACVQVPLPPLDEQRRIVDAIEAVFADLDSGVEALETTRRQLARYRQSVLNAAVAGDLTRDWRAANPDAEPADILLARALAERPPSKKGRPDSIQADHPALPEGWAWASVDRLAGHDPRSITDGPFGSNLKSSHYTDAGPRVIRLQNIGDGEFIDERAHVSQEHFETLVKHHIFAGDLAVASLGQELPRACIIPEAVGPALVKADCVRFSPNHDAVLPRYALFALNAQSTRWRTADSVHGVGRPRLNLGSLRDLLLPLPPLAEQEAIVEAVEERLSVADAVARDVDAELVRARRLRRGILQRAFQGRLVPQETGSVQRPPDPLGTAVQGSLDLH